jgi:hypothetical protein
MHAPGIITEEMAYVAAREGMDPEFVMSEARFAHVLVVGWLIGLGGWLVNWSWWLVG